MVSGEKVPYPSLDSPGQLRRELMWAAHNLIAHPLSEISFWLDFVFPGARAIGDAIHDLTVPEHEPGTGRG